MVGLHNNIGCCFRPEKADDPLIGSMIAVRMKDDQVRVESCNVLLCRAHQHLGSEPAQRTVFNHEDGVGILLMPMLDYSLVPSATCDGLAIKQNLQDLAIRGCAGADNLE
jgi:hypothetical protein